MQLRKRGGKPSQKGPNLMGGPGGKAFADSERDVEINERAVARQMPLLSEFSSYSAWEIEAQRWARMLYNRPISLGVDYFINDLKGFASKTDLMAGGSTKHKLQAITDDNEEATKKGDVYEPIDYVWVFKILKSKYQGPVGAPIARIMKQLSEIEGIIFRESGVVVRNPEGVWGWVVKKRRDRKSLGRYLTNREMSNYLKETRIAKSHKSHCVIGRHWPTLDFAGQMKESEDEQFRESFWEFPRKLMKFRIPIPMGSYSGNRMFTITLK